MCSLKQMDWEKYNRFGKFSDYHFKSEMEVFYHYHNTIKNHFSGNCDKKVLEIGAGFGKNLLWFNYIGIPKENLFANEPDETRLLELRKILPEKNIYAGNAETLRSETKFDIILQSTVFTSVLNESTKQTIAQKMMESLNRDGIILWYDFKYNSPGNKQVKGIKRNEIKLLFHTASEINFFNTTLLPPLARKLGSWYNLLNFLFPFLRTHIVAVIKK